MDVGNLIEEVVITDDHEQPKLISAIRAVIFQCLTTLLWLIISVPCLPLFVLGLFIWGLPPIIPSWSTFYMFFIAVFTEGKPEENIPFSNRVLLLLIFFDILIKAPIHGVCWYIDEVVCSSYHKVSIENPVFLLTSPRCGSTQLSHYLQDDTENFISPTVVEMSFPYLWVWKLFAPILLKLGLKDRFKNSSLVNTEATKRHPIFALKTDVMDGFLRHLYFGMFSSLLGASSMCWGLSFVKLDDPKCNNEEFFDRFVSYNDCMMKKVMHYRGKPNQQMLIKGHFISHAKMLEVQYSGSKFLTVLRNPVDRIQSFINLLKSFNFGSEKNLFPATWRVVRDYVVHTQVPFSEEEMSFYKEPSDNKLVIPFTMYVDNLSATLQRIYSFCGIPIPDKVISVAVKAQNTTHDYTKLKASYNPKYNKSLTSLGVNEKKLREKFSEYFAWIKSLEDCKKTN